MSTIYEKKGDQSGELRIDEGHGWAGESTPETVAGSSSPL
jgi:hypothetical protein